MALPPSGRPVALQRTDRFVARTMNWMYDHLRFVRRHRPVVLADRLENRVEFPELDASVLAGRSIPERAWRKLQPRRLYPPTSRRLRSIEPAVIHSHFGYVAARDHALHQALGVPWFAAFYGADVYLHGREPEWQERYARLFPSLHRALVLGPVMAEALRALGCPADRIVIHPLGVDAEGIPHQERSFERDRPLEILFAGTSREKKGLVYLVEAAGLLQQRGLDFRLHLVGDIGTRPEDLETSAEIERVIRKAGIEPRVVRHSWLEFHQLIDLALRCHLFVAPSVTARDGDAEGTPFVIQQLMLTAMPVISTRHSDIPFLYGPYASLLVPERDAKSLADRIQSYRDAPETILRDGRLLRQRMLEAFDVRRCADRLSDLYEAARAN
jgi:colanic acid/amylovoran biosynthesis glycosyltransferase